MLDNCFKKALDINLRNVNFNFSLCGETGILHFRYYAITLTKF